MYIEVTASDMPKQDTFPKPIESAIKVVKNYQKTLKFVHIMIRDPKSALKENHRNPNVTKHLRKIRCKENSLTEYLEPVTKLFFFQCGKENYTVIIVGMDN